MLLKKSALSMENKVCNKCVMDQQSDPNITFDDKGICNYCHAADRNANQHRVDQTNLPWVIEGIKKRGRGRKYDCVLGLSGGVDSSYALHVLHNWGVRVMTFHCDNGWNTPAADENIMKLVEGMKVPFFRYTINLERFRELQRAFIKSGVPNIEIPTDHVLTSVAWKMARREGVKTIISGGNWQTESIMPAVFGYSAVDLYHIQQIYKQFTGKKLTGLPTTNLAQYMWYRCVEKIKIVNLLDYVDYNREVAQKRLAELYGWQPYGAKHEESVFTKWFQKDYLKFRFNLDKRRPHLSSMIHSGQITREDALQELAWKPNTPHLNIEVCKKLGLDPFKPIYKAQKSHSDYPTHERLRKWAHKIYKHF